MPVNIEDVDIYVKEKLTEKETEILANIVRKLRAYHDAKSPNKEDSVDISKIQLEILVDKNEKIVLDKLQFNPRFLKLID